MPGLRDSKTWAKKQASSARARILRHASPTIARSVPLALLAVIIGWCTAVMPYDNGPAIRSDGAGYHAWTRAILDRDLSFCRWKDAPEFFVSTRNTKTGFCQNKYPPGLALLRFPVMAFLVDRSDPSKTTITKNEHVVSLIFGGSFLWLTCGLMIWTAALLRLDPWRSSIAMMFATFGTGLFHYGTYDSTFTHVYSAFFVAVLLFIAVREHTTHQAMNAALLGVSGFFLFSLRNTNIFLLLELTVAYLAWHRSRGLSLLIRRSVLPIAIGTAIAIGLQLAYNYRATGALNVSSYGEEGFKWNRPMQMEVMFSYERGLFTYYPVFGLAIICGLIAHSSRKLAALLVALVLTYVVLYGYWQSWHLGAGMGHRGFVEIVPVAGLVLSVAWSRWPRVAYSTACIAGALFTLATLQITISYWRGTFGGAGETYEHYWAHQRTVESLITGGTICRPRHCDLFSWNCTTETDDSLSFCMASLVHPGRCYQGRCAPTVALRQLGGDSSSYVTSVPLHGKKARPLEVGAVAVGGWEKFLMFRTGARGNKLRLVSVSTKRYVTAPERDGSPRALISEPQDPTDRETFTRVGRLDNCALEAWNQRFVNEVPRKHRRSWLQAASTTMTEAVRFAIEYVRP